MLFKRFDDVFQNHIDSVAPTKCVVSGTNIHQVQQLRTSSVIQNEWIALQKIAEMLKYTSICLFLS